MEDAVPATQDGQEDAFRAGVAEAVPGAHAAHDDAPVEEECVPAGQGEHTVAPASENVPALHATHADPGDAAYAPAGQVGAQAVAPALEKVEAAQGGHALSAPEDPDAVPGAHGEQSVDDDAPAGEKNPAAHVYGEQAAAPGEEEYAPAGHEVQVAPVGRSSASWPAGHTAQLLQESPCPEGHTTQADAK